MWVQSRGWCGRALSRRVFLWLFGAPTQHATGSHLPLPPPAVPLLLGAARQLFTCEAPPLPAAAAAATDDHDDPLAPRAEALPVSASPPALPPALPPFRTLAHALDEPALADAIAADDALLLTALAAAARCGEEEEGRDEV